MNTCALCHLILTVTPWGIREDTEAQSGYVTWMSIQPVNCWVSFEPTWPLSDPPTATGSHWQAFPGLPLAGAESPWYTLVASLWTVINTLWLTREGGDFFFPPEKSYIWASLPPECSSSHHGDLFTILSCDLVSHYSFTPQIDYFGNSISAHLLSTRI